ncbi:MAG: hypothetical protein N2Z72_03865 [Bacteroidales bacterium]|nr:hypothetical protein [Bacteroidales bacterium]
MKALILFLFCCLSLEIFSQSIGIGENIFVPDPSAGLEIQFTNKGLLIPRVDLSSTNDASTISNPAPGLLIYHNGSAGLPKGFYYNFGTSASPQWTKFAEIRPNNADMWLIGGNANTNPATQFLGTTDPNDFSIRTNNIERMRLTSAGHVGINTSTPIERLQIHNGNLYLSNNNNTPGQIILAVPSSSGNYVTSITAGMQSNNIQYVLPGSLTPTIQPMHSLLQSDLSGNLSWLDRRVFSDVVVKPTDESIVNSTVLQNDDHLTYNLAPNQRYLIEVYMIVNTIGATTQGIRVQVNMPAGATANWSSEIIRDNGSPRVFNTATTAFPHIASIASVRIVRLVAIVNTSGVGGALTVQWAQGTANANATVVMNGSYMRIVQIN